MHTNAFESAFSDFLDSSTYETFSETLFSLTRAAFDAGWKAGRAQALKEAEIRRELLK